MLSWNVAHLELWEDIGTQNVDVALLQEVNRPDGRCPLEVLPERTGPWLTHGWEARNWRTAVVRVSDAVALRERPTVPIVDRDSELAGANPGEATSSYRQGIAVSRPGSITAADVIIDGTTVVTVVSVYAAWDRPLGRDQPCWGDASAHRILSDLTPLMWDQRRHPVIVSGDWNILHGYGEHGSLENRDRYQGLFDRAEALGLRFVGPRYPDGEQAVPWPSELPHDSLCVPTFKARGGATRQLDFVFASFGIAEKVSTQALNKDDEWGPSDHCRVIIDVDL